MINITIRHKIYCMYPYSIREFCPRKKNYLLYLYPQYPFVSDLFSSLEENVVCYKVVIYKLEKEYSWLLIYKHLTFRSRACGHKIRPSICLSICAHYPWWRSGDWRGWVSDFQWKHSRSRQDDTWCTRRGGGRSKHNTSTESEVTMNRGSSLQSRGRGSHHCSCRARPTTGLTCPQGHNCRALDRGTSESDLPTRCDHDARRLARPTQDESLWSISWWSLLILLQRLTVRVSSMWWIWRHLTDPWGCSRRPYI
jgi:hypothetical protein